MEYQPINPNDIPVWLLENLWEKKTIVYSQKWYDKNGTEFTIGIYLNPTDMRHDRMIGTIQPVDRKRRYEIYNQPQIVWVENGWLEALTILIGKAMQVANMNNCFVQVEMAGNNSHSETIDGSKAVIGVGPTGKIEPNFPHVHFHFRRAKNVYILNDPSLISLGERMGELVDMRNGKIECNNDELRKRKEKLIEGFRNVFKENL